jgi:hypothetical protein
MFFRRTKRAAPRPSYRPRFDTLEDRSIPSATTTTLAVSPNPALVNHDVTLTAVVTGGGFTPGGFHTTVSFRDGSTLLKYVNVTADAANSRGVATFTTASLALGTHSITAKYEGEYSFVTMTTNDASVSSAVSLTIIPDVAANVTSQVRVSFVHFAGVHNPSLQFVSIKNTSGSTIGGPLYLVLRGLNRNIHLLYASGKTRAHGVGNPYRTSLATLHPGGELLVALQFSNPKHLRLHFVFQVLAGVGKV